MSYSEVKNYICSLHGKSVNCEINRGRNKIVKLQVLIKNVYSSMFTIEPTSEINLDRKSFSYSDVMCGDIKFF